MKITLLLNQSYPYGYALTKRFHLYAKGFIKNGHSANITVPLPTEKNDTTDNTLLKGIHDEVPFRYTSSSTRRSESFTGRRIHDLIGALNTGRILLNEKPAVIITSSFSFTFLIFLRTISLIIGAKIIRERNEVDNLSKDSLSYFSQIKAKFESKLVDGLIIINYKLKDYIETELNNRAPNVVVPILIEDFKSTELPVSDTIVYTGTYRERKDGILTILKAFALLIKKIPGIKLVLTGSPNGSKDYSRIMDLIAAENIGQHVIFTGYLSEKDLRKTLISARMLIITKPANRQNEYNFPTKLGEYLISGRPVISTRVGIVGEILEDNINILFTEYHANAICDAMEYLVKNQKMAETIGSNGRKYALDNFDYMIHTRQMIDFFYIITKSRKP